MTPTTFLQYVCRRLLGEPDRREGSPLWSCPACKRVKLHCRPPHPRFKDRVACWVCDYHEDAEGLWLLLNPGRYYRHAVAELDAWRREWEASAAGEAAVKPTAKGRGRAGSSSSPGGTGGSGHGRTPREVASAWADLSREDQRWLHRECEVLEFVADLARCSRRFEEFIERTDRRHRERCTDPDCEAACCRQARGLPPLTEQERELTERAEVNRVLELVRQGLESRLNGRAVPCR